jgi:PAS domain S-box-containing protein
VNDEAAGRRGHDSPIDPAQLFERHPQPLWIYDPQSLRILDVNAAAVELYGWTRESFVGMSLADLRPPEEVPRLLEHLSRVSGDEKRPEVWTHRTRDGRRIRVKVTGSDVRYAGRDGRLVAILDVSELEAAEVSARETETSYRALVESLRDVIFELDEEGRFVYLSPAVREVAAFEPSDLTGRTFESLIAPIDRHKVVDAAERVLGGRTDEPVEFRLIGGDGRMRWIRTVSRPLVRGERVVGLRGIASDITAARDADESLRAAREQLFEAQKMEAIARLTGGIAHDFNNLLTVIQGYGELAREEVSRLGGEVELVEEMLVAAGRAAELTRQMLAFGRRQMMRPDEVDLGEIVARVARTLERVIGEDIEVVVRRSSEQVPVFADPGQLEQVVLNLSVNARDAMPQGGRLRLATAMEELGEAAAARIGLPSGTYAVLRVADTGIGIPPELRDRIFDPFFTTKEPGKGSGLGLSTVHGIVRQSGGNVIFDSAPGAGTVFSVYLPLSRETNDTGAQPAPSGPSPPGVVVVLEDDEKLRRLSRRSLESAGFDVVECADAAGVGALVRSDLASVALVVADLRVPGGSGLDLIRKLVERWPAAKVLLVSGYAAEAAIARREGGGLPFLEKPYSPSRLVERVRGVLAGTAPR